MGDIPLKYKPPLSNLEVKHNIQQRIANAKSRNDPKELHRAIKAIVGMSKGHMVVGVENVKPEDLD